MHKGDLERAIIDFGQVIALDPKLAVAYTNRGLARLLQGKDAEAQRTSNSVF
jgi:hypothetical protein